MPKPRILIPLIHRPAGKDYRDNPTPAARVVPHYANGLSPREGDEDLPALACPYGFEAYPGGRYAFVTDWLPDPTWTGELRVTDYHGGRSSSCYAVQITTTDGAPVVGLMSCSSFMALIPRLSNGTVAGTFGAFKRGQNYLIDVKE